MIKVNEIQLSKSTAKIGVFHIAEDVFLSGMLDNGYSIMGILKKGARIQITAVDCPVGYSGRGISIVELDNNPSRTEYFVRWDEILKGCGVLVTQIA